MDKGAISHFNGSHFCKAIVFVICYIFLVQSCVWMMPLPSSRYYPTVPVSSVEKNQGILSDLADAFRGAIDLFLPSKAYAAVSGTEYITFWSGDLRIFAHNDNTKITLIDIDTGALLSMSDSRINQSLTNFLINPFILNKAGDSFEGVGGLGGPNVEIRVRIISSSAGGGPEPKPVTIWTGSLSSSTRHPGNPPSDGNPWMSYIPASIVLMESSEQGEFGREVGRSFLGFTTKEMYIFALKDNTTPTSINIEDLITSTDPDNDDSTTLTTGSPRKVFENNEIEIYFLNTFEDDTVKITSNVDISVLVGYSSQRGPDWTVTPPSYAKGDKGIERGTLFYTFAERYLTVFPLETDTSVIITDLSDADDSKTVTLTKGEDFYQIYTPTLSTTSSGNIIPRNNSPAVTILNNNGNPFDDDFVKVESDKPILVYVGPVGSNTIEFADVAFSVPTGPDSRIIYTFAQNYGNSNDLQVFAFDPDTRVTITSLSYTNGFRGNGQHDFTIGPGIGGTNGWLEGTPGGDVWWGSGIWNAEMLRIESTKPITVLNGDYDNPCFGAFIPFTPSGLLQPVADAGEDQNINFKNQVCFDGTGSYDQDTIDSGCTIEYKWDFDINYDSDGDNIPDNDLDSSSPTFCHIYPSPGTYTARLEFWDDDCQQDDDFVTITVTFIPHPPTANANGPYISAMGEDITLDGSGSFDNDEPDGDSITAYGWEIDMEIPYDFDDAIGVDPNILGFDTEGTYPIGLKVTDNTANAFPFTGSPNLTDEDFTEIRIYDPCIIDLYVRPKATKAQLVWTHIGADEYKIFRSEKGANTGMELIGVTDSTYSTFLDYNVEMYKDYWYRVLVIEDNEDICGSYAVHIISQGRIRNNPPQITSVPPLTAQEDQPYGYDVEATDPDGDAITYHLDQAPDGMTIDSATGFISWTPTASQIGPHYITIRATDTPGASAAQFYILTVNPRPNEPPIANPGGPYSTLLGNAITFDGSESYDPDGDLPLSYQWNFGDGNTSDLQNPSHTYTSSGQYTVTLFVTDTRGATGQEQTTAIVNARPVADAGGPYNGHAQAPITFDGSGSSDPDGDSLSYTWDFGDGTPPETGVGSIHVYAVEGAYSVSLTVNDGRGGTDTDQSIVTITPPNQPPTAQFTCQDLRRIGEDFNFDASSSYDTDGDIVTYEWDFGDGNTAQGAILTHSYQNPENYTVILTVTDDDGATDTATKNVSVVLNLPPEIISAPITTATENVLYTYDVDATDPDGDILTYSLTTAPSGMTIDAASGLINWTPTRDQAGTQYVDVKVEDGHGNSDTQQYTIQVIQTTTIVPDVIGMTQTNAETTITSAILEVGAIGLAYSDTVPEGLVVSQEPAAGTVVSLNSEVDFVLSLGVADIDLEPTSMDTSNVTVDSQTLGISGTVEVVIKNNGTSNVIDPYILTLFEDINTNNDFDTGTDNILGLLTIPDGPLGEDLLTVTVDVSGSMLFKGNLIHAFVDSADQIGETDEGNNITHSMADCELIPPVGSFDPVLEWAWTGSSVLPDSLNVMMTPAVIDLNDDDIPDIVFGSTSSRGGGYVEVGVLRALSGNNGAELFTVTDSSLYVNTASSVAAGDIDLDGKPEIVACDSTGLRLIVFENDGTFKWRSPNLEAIYWGAPSLSDIDMDGITEIIIGRQVLNNDGSIRWTGTGGRGSLGSIGPLSFAADLNLDGKPEIIAGNTAYSNSGSIFWQQTSLPDGLNAVANFDDDPFPEIVLVSSGRVWLLENNGAIKWGPVYIPGGGNGGPPTVADFDNDDEVEIGVAGASRYTVFDTNGSILWASVTQDASSNVTGSSVFDFDGDGSSEVVYRDELYLRVYKGIDGTILFQVPMSSCTWYEYVLVADVDNDNNAEILAVANNNCGKGPQRGVYVFGDLNDTWINTRKIWNQHAYHITNVNDDGTIPQYEANNWESYNNFRQNQMLQPFGCIDLTASHIRVNLSNCPDVEIVARIGNGGALHTAPGIKVAFYDGDPDSGGILLGVTTVDVQLNPGEYADISYINTSSLYRTHTLYVVADDDGTGFGRVLEIDEENNKASATFDLCNRSPAIISSPITTANEDFPYSYDVDATDPDGDTLTYSLTLSPPGMTIESDTGLIQWTPLNADVGDNDVTVQVQDGRGGIDTQSFIITVQNTNDPPQIVSSSPVTVLEEDAPYTYDVNASDEDGDILNYYLTLSPTGMSIDSAAGLIQWVPNQAHIGDNSVTVNVTDGNGGEDNQFFTITVTNVNDPPEILSTPLLTTLEDSVYSYDVEATDEDGDTLIFELSSAPNGMNIDENSGLIQWLPQQADVGSHSITITVSDGNGGSDSQSYTLEVENVNDSPLITSTPLTGAVSGHLYTYDVEATDEDGDTLTYSLTTSPAGMSIDSSTGLIQWTPDQTQVGSHPVEIQVTDGQGGSATQSYTLTVSSTNSAPQITSTPVTTATQDQPYAYDVDASDPDGDPITYSLDTAPSGMTIAPDTGLVQWTPGSTQIGENQVVVAASDNKGAATTQAFTINVQNINDPPEITSTPVTIAGANVLYTYDVEATDIDADTVLYSLDVSPPAMTIDSATGLIQWTPADTDLGDHTIRVRARDPFDAFDTQEYTLTVQQIIDNTPPRVSSIIIDPLILNPGETATITIDAVDNEAIGSYELQVDGVDIPMIGNTATYTATTIGVHEIQATVCDTSDNCDTLIARFGVRDPGDTTPPVVSIKTPATESELTAPTDLIGTASDDNLVSYTLEYSEKEKNNFVEFYKGHTDVTEDVLGTLDPSLLVNGLYDIRLRAVDVNGLTNSFMVTYRITGDLKVGNFTVTFKDLEIPVAGIPITIYRTYDSRIRHNKGDFGYGWNIDIRTTKVEENRELGEGWYSQSSGGFLPTYYLRPDGEHYVSITLPDGQTLEFDCKFTPESQTLYPIQWLNSAVYTPRPGTNGSLVALDDSPMYFDGSQVVNWDFEIYNPNRYQLTTIDGTVYIIDQTEGLKKVTDNNSNSLDITFNGIIHSTGKSVDFTRDTQGRITEITDPMGNSLLYDYDVRGDLIAFTDQEGNTSQYTYNSNHGLVDIFDPSGNRPMRNEYDYDGSLIAHIDAEGNRIEYTHNPDSRQEIVSDRLGNITVFEYDDDGNVTKKTDALGNVTTYTYDVRGNTLSETDPLGNTTTYTYDAKDNMLTKTDPLGNTTSYTYNANGKPLTITDPMGNTTTNTYDAKGNLLSIIDPQGNVLANTYDASGNLSSGTDPLGNVTGYSYDASGNMISQTDPLGNIITFTYDDNGNELTKTFTRTTSSGTETISVQNEYDSMNRLIKNTDPYGNSTITEYNAVGKRAATIDQNGNRTDYEYDSMGNIEKITYPDGTTETSTYDAEGRKTSSTDRAGRTTQYIYDALGRIIKTIYPDGSSTTSTYDAAGRTITQTDTRGNTTSYTYDAAGHRTSIIDPYGNVTNYTYDANGNQITMTDANGNTYVYEYDKNNRLIKTIFPDGTFTTTTYNEIGWKTSETDQAGNTTNFDYDSKGQLIRVTDALGNVTTYEYDELGNKISQTDSNGNTIMWEYDKLGRVTKKIMPLGMVEITEYNAVGNIISKTDFNGNTTTYTYDDNNRIIQKIYPDSSSVSYIYNSTGQKISELDSRGLTTYEYDLLNRLIKRTDPDGTTISYTYDAAGNRTSVTTPSGTTMYSYDSLNRLETVTDPDLGVTTYSYDRLGNRINVQYPNGTKVLYTYDTLNRLVRLENKRSNDSIISSYNYTLGPVGNRIKVQEHTGRTVDYAYDALYRLILENITDPVLGDRIISYSYDPVGNRLTKSDSVDGTISYTYDNNDRLLTENGTTYTYDNNGNTISKTEGSNITTYNYDYENRPVEVNTLTSLIRYIYDSDGIKVSSTVNGSVTSYLVDKNRAYAQVLEETDASSSLIVSYIHGDDLISMKRGSIQYFYHYDGNGNTKELTDFAENITDTYIYDAFGVILNRTGVTENNYLFTGEQYDVNIGFYYLRARYYNQATGRFLTSDPMEPFPGSIYDPPSLHLYVYTKNNPVNYIDPSGNFGICGVMISIAVISIINLIAITWPGSFIGRAYKAIGKLLPDGIILGAAGSAHLLRRIPKFSGRLPFGYGGQAGIEWVLNVGSSEEGFFFYAGIGASISASWSLVRYVAFIYRLHNLLGHYAGPSNAFGIGERIQVGFFFGTGSPSGNYWGLVYSRQIIGSSGFGISGVRNWARPLSVRSYSTMWPMVGYATALGAIIGGYLGRNAASAVVGATMGYIWPFTKWLEGPELRSRQAWRK